MKQWVLGVGIMAAVTFAAGTALSQDYIIYPKEGQDEQQMEQDKYECYSWAKQQSGFDPMQAQVAPGKETQADSSSTGKRVLKGGAGGAAVGAGIGAIAGDAGKGAAAGAIAGGAASGIRGSRQQRQESEQQARQSSLSEQQRQAYSRAFEACMEGKGYTLK